MTHVQLSTYLLSNDHKRSSEIRASMISLSATRESVSDRNPLPPQQRAQPDVASAASRHTHAAYGAHTLHNTSAEPCSHPEDHAGGQLVAGHTGRSPAPRLLLAPPQHTARATAWTTPPQPRHGPLFEPCATGRLRARRAHGLARAERRWRFDCSPRISWARLPLQHTHAPHGRAPHVRWPARRVCCHENGGSAAHAVAQCARAHAVGMGSGSVDDAARTGRELLGRGVVLRDPA